MFERFTDRARHVVVLAQEEARTLHHHCIGTEHILLALVSEGEGFAAKAPLSLKVNADSVREKIVELIGRGEREPTGHIPFTPNAKKLLELALRESMQLGHNYIGTEHLLLGVLRSSDSQAAVIMQRLQLDPALVKSRVIEIVHTMRPEPIDDPTKLSAQLGDTGFTLGDTILRLSDILTAAQLSVEEAYMADKGITLAEAKRQVAAIYDRIGMPNILYHLCVKYAYMLRELALALTTTGTPRNPKLQAAITALVDMCIDELEGPPEDRVG